MMKVTVLYGHPENPESFEKYYHNIHLPIAGKMKGVDRLELTKFISGAGGREPEYYRMAELYFTSREQMEKSLESAEGQAAVADIDNFATGGVTLLLGTL